MERPVLVYRHLFTERRRRKVSWCGKTIRGMVIEYSPRDELVDILNEFGVKRSDYWLNVKKPQLCFRSLARAIDFKMRYGTELSTLDEHYRKLWSDSVF